MNQLTAHAIIETENWIVDGSTDRQSAFSAMQIQAVDLHDLFARISAMAFGTLRDPVTPKHFSGRPLKVT